MWDAKRKKKCPKCGKELFYDDYYRQKYKTVCGEIRYRPSSKCKICMKETASGWVQKHLEDYKHKYRERYNNDPVFRAEEKLRSKKTRNRVFRVFRINEKIRRLDFNKSVRNAISKGFQVYDMDIKYWAMVQVIPMGEYNNKIKGKFSIKGYLNKKLAYFIPFYKMDFSYWLCSRNKQLHIDNIKDVHKIFGI